MIYIVVFYDVKFCNFTIKFYTELCRVQNDLTFWLLSAIIHVFHF